MRDDRVQRSLIKILTMMMTMIAMMKLVVMMAGSVACIADYNFLINKEYSKYFMGK